MGITLVSAKHATGVHENGHDGCFARATNGGNCPGEATAQWLNGLGDDDALYTQPTQTHPHGITNGQVRQNYLSNSDHIVAVDPTLARLTARQKMLERDLRHVKNDIKRHKEVVRG